MTNNATTRADEILRAHGYIPVAVADPAARLRELLELGRAVLVWEEGACMLHCSSAVTAEDILTRALSYTDPEQAGACTWRLKGVESVTDAIAVLNSGAIDALSVNGRFIEIDEIVKHCASAEEVTPERAEDLLGHLERGLKCSLQPAIAWNLYGKLLRQMGRDVDSAAAFRTALEHNASFGEAYSNFGTLLWMGGAQEEGFRMLAEAVLKNPSDETGWLNFFDAGYELGFYQAMVNVIEGAQGIPAELSAAIGVHHAICLSKAGRFEEARELLTKHLEKYPSDEDARIVLAEVHTMLGDAPAGEKRP